MGLFFTLQIFIPFRYLLYPGNLLWTEQGYRFSWRVMLMEKSGTCFFYVKDGREGKKFQVNNAIFLTPYQERMVETQPDMILQYAKILADNYRNEGMHDPQVTVESYVSLNGSGSRLFIDSSVNLVQEKEAGLEKRNGFYHIKMEKGNEDRDHFVFDISHGNLPGTKL